ncbi:phosphoesterase RecJ domain-containing protein [Pseudoflavonifractor sp. BIOML-A6]|nr:MULTISPECIES: DHH family phosphoesterase [unclassified Pseudoflavonifractor]MTQ98069.1 phosphoesterase RecJ domain-containing protein [Pseudoflavonifractor sp. BIOML-A16]MTR05820.1 phosphoesterase RecJ domain-containing protein [Pseudoflavonifractor sp. BIOML-A15]MTR33892.1 phosphoesterase RecJ domain-containing protein [Pseudoflavonifractor sp. BIOML-A14]MTR71459.1 phosphoesterase RecJ domain-containing protein [Pseudoflavonifractor sp. BIOML-A18]MTS63602.1 phosphoesterase RecJ domain-cont
MDYREAAALLAEQNDILILTHKRPDGDTIGCAVGLCAALRKLGKTAWVLPNADATSLFTPYLEGCLAPGEFAPRFVVSVDIAGRSLFPENAKVWLERGVDLAIDHHPSNEGFGRENCVDAGRAACGELIFDLVREWGEIDAAIALPLYVAVSTDTGCFVYGNTTPGTHRVAAALMETGIDYRGVNKRHFRTKSFKRLRLESMLCQNMELFDGGRIAVAAVTLEMMAVLDAREEDAEDVSAFAGQVEGVQTAVTIRELRPGECKLSVRTSAGLNASAVCALLGGGGHAAASGCTVHGSVEEAKRAILEAIEKVKSDS